MQIVPLQFLKAVLPNPQDLGENYEGETSIGCRIRGLKDGKRAYLLHLQQLQPPCRLQGDGHAGRELYHGRSRHDRRA
jgi:saccharopine dehydrogenase-like NADP-dependent oxidoreductase